MELKTIFDFSLVRGTKMMFTVTALILSTSLVLGDFHQHPEYCNNETLKVTSLSSNTLLNNFMVSMSLQCISITDGSIRLVEEGAFDGVPNLMYLNLERNSIRPEDLFSFGNLPSVRVLILGNQVRRYRPWGIIDDVMIIGTVYPELLHLNAKNNNITSILTNGLNNFPKLTHLDLSNNKLTFFDLQSWSDSLTHLNLNDNQISQIRYKKLTNLTSLTIDTNKIGYIGEGLDLDLSGLSSLEYLSVSNNQIRYIAKSAFADTVNLRCLNMSENSLETLDMSIFTPLTSLEVIVLNKNMFDTIPLNEPLNVTTLLMDCNKITELTPDSLSQLTNLRKLSLAGNMISNIHVDTFKFQELLEELYLNDNDLEYLPVHWNMYTKNLRYLDLSGNKFNLMPFFLNTPNIALEQIYLDENPLQYIGGNVTIPENMTIYLNIGQERLKPVCKQKPTETESRIKFFDTYDDPEEFYQ